MKDAKKPDPATPFLRVLTEKLNINLDDTLALKLGELTKEDWEDVVQQLYLVKLQNAQVKEEKVSLKDSLIDMVNDILNTSPLHKRSDGSRVEMETADREEHPRHFRVIMIENNIDLNVLMNEVLSPIEYSVLATVYFDHCTLEYLAKFPLIIRRPKNPHSSNWFSFPVQLEPSQDYKSKLEYLTDIHNTALCKLRNGIGHNPFK